MKFLSDYKPGKKGLNKVLGNLESEIMDIIWDRDYEVCVRDVYEDLNAKRSIAYTTVMTIMGRLADKKVLIKRKEGNTFFFKPSMNKEEFTQKVVENVLNSLLEDFADTTMSHFISRISKDDLGQIEHLEKMLKDSEEK